MNIIDLDNVKKIKIKSLDVYNESGNFYFKGVWEYSNNIGRYELTIPKIDLGISANSPIFIKEDPTLYSLASSYTYLHGFNRYELTMIREDEKGIKCYIKEIERFEKEMTIEEIEKEMTIEEIEQKLGHKVKIVGQRSE